MKYIEILTEKYVDNENTYTFTSPNMKEPCVVYKNPSFQELLKVCSNDEVGMFILDDDNVIAWNIYTASHKIIRNQLNLKTSAIPIVLFFHDQSYVHITLTTDTKNTQWWHSREVSGHVLKNKFLNRNFRELELSFYDEDTYGKWDSPNQQHEE